MKSLSFASFISGVLFVCATFPASAQWQIMTETGGIYVSKCSFPTADVGYVIGNYSFSGWYAILKTTDGGQSWNEIFTQGPLNESLFDLHFVSAEEGYLSLRSDVGPTMISRVWHTTNGGQCWDNISPSNGDPGFGNAAIYALPGGHVFQGSSVNLNTTHNNGLTWVENTTEIYDSALSMSMADANFGAAGMWDGTFLYSGSIYVTSDGGTSWQKTAIDKAYSQIVAVATPDNQTVLGLSKGIGFGEGFPSLYRSFDAGASWDTLAIPALTGQNAMDMALLNDTLYIASNSLTGIHRSSDMGETVVLETETPQAINCVCAAQNTIYAFGDFGLVLKKTSVASSVSEQKAPRPALFPNPAKNFITWKSDKTIREIRLTDIAGKTVLRFFPGTTEGSEDINRLASGVYSVLFLDASGTAFTEKLMVE